MRYSFHTNWPPRTACGISITLTICDKSLSKHHQVDRNSVNTLTMPTQKLKSSRSVRGTGRAQQSLLGCVRRSHLQVLARLAQAKSKTTYPLLFLMMLCADSSSCSLKHSSLHFNLTNKCFTLFPKLPKGSLAAPIHVFRKMTKTIAGEKHQSPSGLVRFSLVASPEANVEATCRLRLTPRPCMKLGV